MKFGYMGLMVAILTCTVAFADPDPYKIVTSKAYVDTKQSQIPAESAGQLATHSGTAGEFGTPKSVATSIGTNSLATTIPTTGAVVSAFNSKFPANGGTDQVVTLGSSAGAPSSQSIRSTINLGSTLSTLGIPTDGAVYDAADTRVDKPTCTYTSGNKCYTWTFSDAVDSGGTPQSQCIARGDLCDTSDDQCCSGTVCYGTKNAVCTMCIAPGGSCGKGSAPCCGGLTCDGDTCILVK